LAPVGGGTTAANTFEIGKGIDYDRLQLDLNYRF